MFDEVVRLTTPLIFYTKVSSKIFARLVLVFDVVVRITMSFRMKVFMVSMSNEKFCISFTW